MTLDGTNGYIIDGGGGAWLTIDPGPAIAEHIEAFVGGAVYAHPDAKVLHARTLSEGEHLRGR